MIAVQLLSLHSSACTPSVVARSVQSVVSRVGQQTPITDVQPNFLNCLISGENPGVECITIKQVCLK